VFLWSWLIPSPLQRRVWLRMLRWRFDHHSPRRRIRLELRTDGRQIPYLLSAIYGAGYGIQIAHGDMLFRELLALRHHVPLAARVDASPVDCAFTLTDDPERADHDGYVYIDYDVFSRGRVGHRMPYSMHPNIYYKGNHFDPWTPNLRNGGPRLICIGFYGTHDPLFYSRSYLFKGLNRTQLLDHFLSSYGQHLTSVPTHQPTQFAISIDRRGGDLHPKTFLSQSAYLDILRKSSFSLCLPGWCMPLSHGLIEAMYNGTIPITNAHAFMYPPLQHGVNALTFNTLAEFDEAIDEAQSMPESLITAMRLNVAKYYRDYLDPSSWWCSFVASGDTNLLVNAEELSVPLMTSIPLNG
jgi:hypothetical protein